MSFTSQISCLTRSKRGSLKDDQGPKPRPNFRLFDSCKTSGMKVGRFCCVQLYNLRHTTSESPLGGLRDSVSGKTKFNGKISGFRHTWSVVRNTGMIRTVQRQSVACGTDDVVVELTAAERATHKSLGTTTRALFCTTTATARRPA